MVNKIILVGNVGGEPEIKNLGESKLAVLTVATTEKFTKNGEKQEKTEWHRINIWGKLAEIAEKYVKKGDKIYVEGKLQYQQWESKAGEKHSTAIVNASNIVLLGAKKENNKTEQPAPKQYPKQEPEWQGDGSGNGDDLPF